MASKLLESEICENVDDLQDIVRWVGSNYHEDWLFARGLSKGIGVHHGRVPRALAQHNVRAFNTGSIKFLICTSSY